MVWGMKQPSNFGQFWPEGEFEAASDNAGQDGWRLRLVEYYRAQSPEEQRRLFDFDSRFPAHGYASFAYGKFIYEPGAGGNCEHPDYTPIEPHEVPRYYLSRPYRSLGSFIVAGLPAVDEDLKAIIERFEPGVHQFFPIPIIIGRNQKQTDKKYFIVVIRRYFDAYLPKVSDMSKKNFAGIAYSKAVFGDAHLWRDRGTPAITCLSDEIKAEIVKAGLRLPKPFTMQEV